jgi:hypothetical protein
MRTDGSEAVSSASTASSGGINMPIDEKFARDGHYHLPKVWLA